MMAMWSLETIAEKTAPPTVSARSTWHIMPVTSALRRGPGFKVFMRELERVGCSWFSWTTLLCELHAIYLLHTPALPIQSSNSWPLDPICRCMSISKHCVFFLKHLYDSANLKKNWLPGTVVKVCNLLQRGKTVGCLSKSIDCLLSAVKCLFTQEQSQCFILLLHFTRQSEWSEQCIMWSNNNKTSHCIDGTLYSLDQCH